MLVFVAAAGAPARLQLRWSRPKRHGAARAKSIASADNLFLFCYNRRASRFAAGFFGTPTMNFLEGTVEGGTAAGPTTTLRPESAGVASC